MRRFRTLGWVVGLVGVLVGLGAGEVQAGIDFIEVQTTLVPLGGAGAAPGASVIVSETGQVVLVTVADDGTHIIPVELGGVATPLVYSYEDGPVGPVSATFGPNGDVLLRGAAGDPRAPLGVTARIALDGTVVWETPDTGFSETDAYVGLYEAPVGPIVWSGTRQRVLIFSRSSFQVAPVSQASALFEFDGAVREPSVLFGTEYIGATLGNALRTPQGKFLVYYLSENDVGARFFIYDGIETITAWRPEGGDWTQRIVYLVKYDPDGNLILLWNDVATSDQPGRLTKLDPDGKLVWEQELGGAIEVIDPEAGTPIEVTMGRPVFMVTASSEVVLLRQAGPTFVFDVRSTEDGSALGFSDFFQLTEHAVYDLAFLEGSEHDYLLSTVDSEDPEHNHLLQVRLTFNDDPVVIHDPDGTVGNNGGIGENNGGPLVDDPNDMDEDDGPPHPRVGCACSTRSGSPVEVVGALLLALALGWWRRRS